MKLFFTSIISILSIFALAQAPQNISYQAIARLSNGSPISNQAIGVKIMIYQGSVGSVLSYEETHTVNTNQFGLFTLFIGGGTPTIGTFNTINWATGSYFVETLIDPAGGSSYSSLGTQQLMSVPYALYAEKVGNASPTPTLTINAPNSVTSASGSYSINIPAPTIYTAGNGINITSGVITNTATAITPTITGTGAITVSGIYPSLTINTPTTQSYSAGTGISISTAGVITNTATSITPTLVAGTNMIVNPTIASNSYTVSSPSYSIGFPGGSIVQLTNGINTTTTTIPMTNLTLTGAGNNILSAGGNAVSLNTYTVGNNLNMSSGPNYTITAPSYSLVTNSNTLTLSNGLSSSSVNIPPSMLSLTGNSLSIVGGNMVTLPPQIIMGTGTGIATVTTSANNFTVSVPPPTYTPGNGVLSFGTNTISVSPTLTLTGNVLSSGSLTNSVNISSISPWTQSVGSVTLSNAGDKVGIGTNAPNAALDVVTNANSISAGILSNTNTSNIANVLEVANTSTVGGKGIYTHTSGGNALYGTTTSGFPAIEALGGSSNAFYGTANSSTASFAGTNNGIGEVYYASKTSGQSGSVAKFENLSSTNTAPALYVSSSTSGEAIHAVSSNTVTGTSGIFDGNVIVNGNITIPGANDYKYASAKTKYLNIPSNALHSMSGAYDVTLGTYVVGYDGESGYAYIANGGTTGATAVATAPVYLPDGAVVTELYVRYYDQDATYNGTFSLERKNISSINNQTMVSYTSVGSASSPSGPGIQSLTTILNPIIDNANYAYYFKFKTTQLNTNIAVLDIRITYTVLKAD